MQQIQYYSHLLLNSKYVFIFKLIIFCTFYFSFNYNKFIYCTNDNLFELERIRVYEKVIAITTKEPEQILEALEEAKQKKLREAYNVEQPYQDRRGITINRRKKITLNEIESYSGEKKLLTMCGLHFSSPEKIDEVYYLLRLYRRLNKIDVTTARVQEEHKAFSILDYISPCNIS